MKTYLIPLVLMLTLMGCRGDLNADFRKVIIEYQKKFPLTELAATHQLPEIKDPKLKKMYIYQAYFYKNGRDTLFVLTGNYGVVEDDFYYQGYEIYSDSKIKAYRISGLFQCKRIFAAPEDERKNTFFMG